MSETSAVTENTDRHYGKDCPVGMVQVEFVGCDPSEKRGEYGWKPVKSAFIEVYVDGERYRIDIGTFTDHHGWQRRGLHIVTDCEVNIDAHSVNAVDLFIDAPRARPARTAGRSPEGSEE